MKLQPVHGERALYWEKENAIIIADLHIGMELEFRQYGINIPFQTKKMIERCSEIVNSTNADKLIILGDLKHVIYDMEGMNIERKHVAYFIKEMSEKVEIILIKGNHDGNIRSSKIKIYGSRGVKIDDIFLFHGHAWPSKEIANSSLAVVAHLHPHLRIVNDIGYSSSQPCWVRGKMKRDIIKRRYGRNKKIDFILMPAFNELAGGVAVNEFNAEKVFSIMDIDNASAFSLDGINFGRIRNLRYAHIMHGDGNESADN